MPTHQFDSQSTPSNRTGKKVLHIAGHVGVGVIFAVAFAFIFAILVKLLWNAIMPAVFDVKTITFWHAFGLVVLAKLIFGGFGHHTHDRWTKDHGNYWHKAWHPSEDESFPPRRFSRDWRIYRQYWQEEGKAAFENYLTRGTNNKE